MDKENINKFANNKEYFVSKIKDLDIDQRKLIADQIELFYAAKVDNDKQHNYSLGDKVVLNANTLIHGVREQDNIIDRLQSIKDYGIISRSFITDRVDWKVNYCVSAWHIKKTTALCDYIKLYSGMTVRTALKENVIVPYGEFDNFVLSLKNKDYKYIFAEHCMENTFLPSLISNTTDKQIAVILHSKDNSFKNMLKNNLFSKYIPNDTIQKFFCVNDYDKVLNQRDSNEYDRIAYIPFGIPSIFIAGFLVGRKLEKNKKSLTEIKSIFPNCYICNLDGVVIS